MAISSASSSVPRDHQKLFKNVFLAGVACTLLGMFVLAILFWYFSRGLPKIISVEDYRPVTVTRVLGNNGQEDALFGEFYTQRRYVIPYEKIPDIVVRSFISAEDDRFFEHPGINIVSIIRASIANFKAGHVVQGGSTITQQVAKSLLLTPERSFDRKIKEVILSTRIERNLTKEQILYLYLNQIYLGHGSYGVQAAARTYFRKDISQITIPEAAMLAGLPQAPGKYSPLLNPKKAKERQLYVLRRLFENKYISQSQMTEAAATPLKIFHDEDINNRYSGYLVEHVRRYLVEKYGAKAVNEDGLTVHLPTSPELAMAAHKSIQEGLLAVDKRIGYRGPLKRLASTEEIEKFLRDQRIKLIDRKLHYQVLLPDGRMDPVEAMHLGGVQSDVELLQAGELYEGVVIGFDTKKRTARVMVGAIRCELPIEHMRWARAVKDEANPGAPRPEPTSPSQLFARGDVIQVRLVSATKNDAIVALEQTPLLQGALLSMEAQTGYVLAMEGGFDYNLSEFNRATQAQRQPGSAFKSIIYAAAVEKGFTPASIIVDSPIVFKESDGLGSWKPTNYEEKFYGDTTFRQALIKSRNIPTIKIAQTVQIPYVLDFAKRLGINGQFPKDLSVSLGSGQVSLLEMTRAYSLFPRLGRQVKPVFYTKIFDRDGKLLEEQKPSALPPSVQIPGASPSGTPSATPSGLAGPAAPLPPIPPSNLGVSGVARLTLPSYPTESDPEQVMDPRVAYIMTHLMKEVVAYGTGHEAKNLGRVSAGKTGTTSDNVDAWFMGFTPHVVTGVWVGYDGSKNMGSSETGARAALPIWLGFMREAVKPYPDTDFTVPPGVVFASINSQTGRPASPNSSQSIREAFIEGTQPGENLPSSTQVTPESDVDFFKEDTQ